MTNEELELIIGARVEEALKKQQEEKKKAINEDNIFLNEYCSLNKLGKDNLDHIDHKDNIKFLKKSWKKFLTKDPEFEKEKNIVAQKLGTIKRLLEYDLKKWEDEQED